jgi:hypothetical protein
MLRDDALEQFPAALSMVESTALTVVINTWFAAYLSPQAQAQYFEMISAYCRGGNVAWISIEGNFGLNWPSPPQHESCLAAGCLPDHRLSLRRPARALRVVPSSRPMDGSRTLS